MVDPIDPTLPDYSMELVWVPEPFLISIKEDGVIPHPEPASTNIPVFMAATVPEVVFFRHATYYPSENHRQNFIDNMYRWVLDDIYLVSDGKDDEIYCLAFSSKFGFPLLFGKLVKECDLYHICVAAFAEIF